MMESAYSLKCSEQMRRCLASIVAAASTELRPKLLKALSDAEKTIRRNPRSCSAVLFDLPTRPMQVRVAFFLPLACYIAIDDDKHEVYLHDVKVISEPHRLTKNSAC